VVCAARVLTFDNLGGDSSLDTRVTPSPEGRIEKRASSMKWMTKECVLLPPSASSEFLGCAYALRIGHI
jgi:hypothetical protein